MEQFREKRNGVLFVNTLTDEEYHSSTEAGLALKFSLYQKIETSLKTGYSHFYLYDPGWFEIYASDVLSVIKEYFPHMKVHLVLSKTYFAQYFFQDAIFLKKYARMSVNVDETVFPQTFEDAVPADYLYNRCGLVIGAYWGIQALTNPYLKRIKSRINVRREYRRACRRLRRRQKGGIL